MVFMAGVVYLSTHSVHGNTLYAMISQVIAFIITFNIIQIENILYSTHERIVLHI